MTTANIPMSSDTFLSVNNATTNYNTNTLLYIGESNAVAGRIWRTLIVPDFSSIPADMLIQSATLYLTPITDLSSNQRTMYAHRCLRDVVFAQTTWNVYSTGNNWGAGGCSDSSADYDGAVVMGSMTVPASPTLNAAMGMALLAEEMQKLYDGTYTNNGLVLFVATQSDDAIAYASTDYATSGYRPYITITYGPLHPSAGEAVVDISGYGRI